MDAYFAAKARLFDPRHCTAAAIGIDDEFGRRLAATVTVPRLTFSSRTTAADIHASRVRADEGGTTFTLHGAGDRESVRLRLLGVHQVDNALAAISALVVRGVDLDTAIGDREPRHHPGTPGGRGRGSAGRVIAVVGATGERDPGKRAPLGATAARFADIVIVTDESPYSEDAQRLREDVACGARSGGNADVLVVPDRAEAIAAAVTLAAPGDVVVIAGRGHDQVQACGPRRRVFDDRSALHEALLRLS